MSGTVKIHGKEYKTVALRVNEFRAERPDWGIVTELVSADEEKVIMKASIIAPSGYVAETGARFPDFVVGTGYAEERRTSSQINKTSALENCETSAIGRALAACGYAGTEYASANEVQNAIQQQVNPDPVDQEKVSRAVKFFKGVIDDDQIEADHVRVKDAWKRLTNDERLKVQDGLGEKAPDSNRMYKTILKDYLNYVPSEGVM